MLNLVHDMNKPAPAGSSAMSILTDQRERACRLRPEFALTNLEEAEKFLIDRRLLTLTPDCSLPSLFGACHEEPYAPGKAGFGQWPKTKWWWASALASRPGVYLLKVHRGRSVYLSTAAASLVDPLCRKALEEARAGAMGTAARELVDYLDRVGPALVEDILTESRLEARTLRQARTALERRGAIIARESRVKTPVGGHRHTSELATWTHAYRAPATEGDLGLEGLVIAGVAAAVVAPESEILRWFTWSTSQQLIDSLAAAGRLWRPQPGWVASGASPSLFQGRSS
jgi:hypothetical protein